MPFRGNHRGGRGGSDRHNNNNDNHNNNSGGSENRGRNSNDTNNSNSNGSNRNDRNNNRGNGNGNNNQNRNNNGNNNNRDRNNQQNDGSNGRREPSRNPQNGNNHSKKNRNGGSNNSSHNHQGGSGHQGAAVTVYVPGEADHQPPVQLGFQREWGLDALLESILYYTRRHNGLPEILYRIQGFSPEERRICYTFLFRSPDPVHVGSFILKTDVLIAVSGMLAYPEDAIHEIGWVFFSSNMFAFENSAELYYFIRNTPQQALDCIKNIVFGPDLLRGQTRQYGDQPSKEDRDIKDNLERLTQIEHLHVLLGWDSVNEHEIIGEYWCNQHPNAPTCSIERGDSWSKRPVPETERHWILATDDGLLRQIAKNNRRRKSVMRNTMQTDLP